MNNGPLLFFGVLVTLATSFWGLIIAPQLQFGRQQPRLIEATGEYYPSPRPGVAERGADIYRSLGCVECHTQQTRQSGVHLEVWITELTTNAAAVVKALLKGDPSLKEAELTRLLAKLPARFATGLTAGDADIMSARVKAAGATTELGLVVFGTDIQRGWGKRMSVAQDYLRDQPVQLGQVRIGPDLANYGSRQTNANLILLHLYEPKRTMPGSIMPPYRFLFEERDLAAGQTAPEGSIVLKPATEAAPGRVAVPKESAHALTAYLMSLRSETPLFEAPVGKSPAAAAPAAPAP